MRALRSWLGLLGILTLGGLPAPAAAQAVGAEFQINTYTTGYQGTRSFPGHHLVAADASGNFVVVWHGRGEDDDYGLFGQRYDSAGVALGSEFRVNSYTTSYQQFPAVASDPDGNFVVVWASYGQDGSSSGIFGQRYDSEGVPWGAEFLVNSRTRAQQFAPSVAADAGGDFVVVWDSYDYGGSGWDVFAQRYDSNGVAQGDEFRVNSYTTDHQEFSSVAAGADGHFVVVWSSDFQDGDSHGVFGQRFDSAGAAQGDEFRVNSYTTINQWFPAVASDPSGNFVVVWEGSVQDGSSYGVFGQRYDGAGVPQGTEFRVNSYTPDSQAAPSVVSDASGNFVVAWMSYGQDGSSWGVFGQRYDAAGMPQGTEFQISSFTTDRQWLPSVGVTGVNQLVVAWESLGQDGSSYGVFGQRYDFGGGASTMHVGDLDRRARNVGASWRAQVKTRVHDDGHSPLSGALVTLDVSGVGSRTCTTTARGSCEVSVVASDSVPSLTFTVTNLSKAGFSYDAETNHDPDPDSDGTTIVVNQP